MNDVPHQSVVPLVRSPLEQAIIDDRLWFAANPGMDQRVRPMVDGEFGPIIFVHHGTGAPLTLVKVMQIRPGARLRRPYSFDFAERAS